MFHAWKKYPDYWVKKAHRKNAMLWKGLPKKHMNGNDITLAEFLEKNRGFDAVYAIGSAVNTIYNRKGEGTL